ncbi:glycoside hydrolase family 3 N-terminal domain-containing protein [Coraliomargarita parva]|uniref:glycoside hydrolase family 3 N-terminal domain-containing protein n=1 Tax=Coraliomargarita parva TaxID=3014050 RepID=UPI0022B52246|nr:glycoside hydrolase family 3 N-terminal domain-containing protein [Coraliomargarita parva]
MSETYKDPNQTIEARIADLMSRMTLEEKVGQLLQLDGGRGDLDELIFEKQVGSLLHIQGERASQAIDKAANTRLGIPLLIGDDCIHGHSFCEGATIFPTQLAMACSWNRELIEEAARITAKEVAVTGIKWTFSPVLCLTRDLRWGRVGETFGEDPYLIGEFACAMIRGYQGDGLGAPDAILACAKHYAGYSETQGGRDASEADHSQRKLRSYFLPPFEKAARNGCLTFMTGYQSIDGVPSTASRWLLHDVLKEEWGFQGILVTDWDNVGRMHWEQKIVPDMTEASAVAIQSGNDLIMSTPGFLEGALEACRTGRIKEAEIDAVVYRILSLKFKMGLFENPGKPDPLKQIEVVGCEAHRELNLKLARRSIVLLQNDGTLPLQAESLNKIAVIGPNADDQHAQLGDWAGASGQVEWLPNGHPRECTKTVLDGIRELAPEGCEILYEKGAEISEYKDVTVDDYDDGQVKRRMRCSVPPDAAQIQAASEAAAQADITVVVIGDDRSLTGEQRSTATLELQGGQLALLDALAKVDTKLIVVLINSKPLTLPPAVQNACAIIEAFNPGMMGGQAIAEAIYGKINPSGKLTVSIPYHVGQQPVYYSQVRGQHGDRYADSTQQAHFPFGFGLSYTKFEYSGLKILDESPLPRTGSLRFSVHVKNTGNCAGRETVQAYISDLVTSVTWVNKELKAFTQVDLEAGEGKEVEWEIPITDCSIVNVNCERVVEPGEFELKVGGSSLERDLLKTKFSVA